MTDLDLNLLRVFDTLMEHRSVTRAAVRLHLTQSAVSHALGRLRAALGDPLFVRRPGGLQPTTRAEEIAPGIREGLTKLRGALAHPEFDPATATRRFTIAAGSYFCELLVPPLVDRLRRSAPGVSLRVAPITDALIVALDRGAVDVALVGSVRAPAHLLEETLWREEMVWIAAADNPLAGRPFDPELVATLPRVAISIPRPLEPLVTDETIAQLFPRLEIESASGAGDAAVNVYDAQTAIAIVARSDWVSLVPGRLAAAAAGRGAVAILSPPIITSTLSMLWHVRQRSDAGLSWLRSAMRTALG